ncbi:MAG: cysteine synthase A [Tannerella sp.]|jgi:cysteine synthase A|nr:cysteine synthase A [Tannerella sp.]
MGKIAKTVTELIGNTPLLELTGIEKAHDVEAHIIGKLEYFNPGRSVKDRIGLSLIEDAEWRGLLNPDSTIIEPTSGNTGIAIAMIAAAKGYRSILTMPETMSLERRVLLKALGAQLELTPGSEGMNGAQRRAEELHAAIPNSVILQQLKNPANPEVHRHTTGVEIWKDTDGGVDIFVGGTGTGGTVSGVGETLKLFKPEVKIVAVEPAGSPVLSGGSPGPHQIQGIGPGFIPDNYNPRYTDEVFPVENEAAVETGRQLALVEGLLVGISSGAAAYAAIQIAKRPENRGKNIVVLLPDTGERYLSTILFN